MNSILHNNKTVNSQLIKSKVRLVILLGRILFVSKFSVLEYDAKWVADQKNINTWTFLPSVCDFWTLQSQKISKWWEMTRFKEVRLEIYSGSWPVCPSAHDLAPEQLNKNQSAVAAKSLVRMISAWAVGWNEEISLWSSKFRFLFKLH